MGNSDGEGKLGKKENDRRGKLEGKETLHCIYNDVQAE